MHVSLQLVDYIVVGENAAPSDMATAQNIKQWCMQLWLTPIITDDQVTSSMLTNNQLLLVGGWINNTVSAYVNNNILHYTAQSDGIYDSSGNNLGTCVVQTVQNFSLVWGLSAADTVTNGNQYVGQNDWELPLVITGIVTCGVGLVVGTKLAGWW
jgi:hypothetical protein